MQNALIGCASKHMIYDCGLTLRKREEEEEEVLILRVTYDPSWEVEGIAT